MTRYIWDVVSDNVLMETDDAGETTAVYTQEPDRYGELISQHRDGQTSYYHFDGEGNTRALTDANQNIVETATYSAFGEVVEKTSSIVNPFGYKGALGYYTNAETNDIYVRARTYEPSIGRWLSQDPMGFIDGICRYQYANNSPTFLIDPSGTQSLFGISPELYLTPNYCYGCQAFAARFSIYSPSPSKWHIVQHLRFKDSWFECADGGCSPSCIDVAYCECEDSFYEYLGHLTPRRVAEDFQVARFGGNSDAACASHGSMERSAEVRLFNSDLTKEGIWAPPSVGFDYCGWCFAVVNGVVDRNRRLYPVPFKSSTNRKLQPPDWGRHDASASWNLAYDWDCCQDPQHTSFGIAVSDSLGARKVTSDATGSRLGVACGWGDQLPRH